MMKNLLKGTVLIGMISMLLTSQVFARDLSTGMTKEPLEQEENHSDNLKNLSGYRCLNSGCQGYLVQRNQLAKCAFCDSTMYAYQCKNCGSWYPICGNVHYNTAVGRCILMHTN